MANFVGDGTAQQPADGVKNSQQSDQHKAAAPSGLFKGDRRNIADNHQTGSRRKGKHDPQLIKINPFEQLSPV